MDGWMSVSYDTLPLTVTFCPSWIIHRQSLHVSQLLSPLSHTPYTSYLFYTKGRTVTNLYHYTDTSIALSFSRSIGAKHFFTPLLLLNDCTLVHIGVLLCAWLLSSPCLQNLLKGHADSSERPPQRILFTGDAEILCNTPPLYYWLSSRCPS